MNGQGRFTQRGVRSGKRCGNQVDAQGDAQGNMAGGEPSRAPRESAVAAAVRLLSYSSRTEQELNAALLRRGYSEGEAAEALAQMKRLGYIDDAGTARRWAESAAGGQRWGVAGIAMRLARRGIDPELADTSARQAYEETGSDELSVALELARSKFDVGAAEDHQERERQMRRLAGFLQRRGFSSETVSRVLKQLF